MRTNSFDFERALEKMERLRKNNRSQEEIIDDLKRELATINELSLLTHAMRLIVELDCRKSSELYINVESPMKQALYLIDVYYSIADRDGIEDITDAKWDVISQLLDEMEMAFSRQWGFRMTETYFMMSETRCWKFNCLRSFSISAMASCALRNRRLIG